MQRLSNSWSRLSWNFPEIFRCLRVKQIHVLDLVLIVLSSCVLFYSACHLCSHESCCSSQRERIQSGSPTCSSSLLGLSLSLSFSPRHVIPALSSDSAYWQAVCRATWPHEPKRLGSTGSGCADTAPAFWSGGDWNAIKAGPSVPLAVVCLG